MTQGEKKWLETVADIIDQLASKYHYTKASVDASPGDVFFDDACKYVDLVFELDQFTRTLRGMLRFSELIEDKSEKK